MCIKVNVDVESGKNGGVDLFVDNVQNIPQISRKYEPKNEISTADGPEVDETQEEVSDRKTLKEGDDIRSAFAYSLE